MIQLADLRIFLEAAACGKFSETARRLKMPKSSVTRQIERLEATVGRPLFERAARSVTLTQDGRDFLPRARRLYDDGIEAENALQANRAGANGLLTISATAPFARAFVVPRLPRFLDRHPNVQVALWLTPARMEVGSGSGQVDIAIRLRSSAGPNLANRKLGDIGFCVVAAPDYLARHGTPHVPDDLRRHQIVEIGPPNKAHEIELRKDRQIATIRYAPRLQIDDPEAVCIAAAGGAGVAIVPRFAAARDLAAGTLVQLMPDWSLAPIPVNLMYRNDIAPPARVRAYADYLSETFAADSASF